MRTTEQLSVALSHDMPAQVRARVAQGAHASETDLVDATILPNFAKRAI